MKTPGYKGWITALALHVGFQVLFCNTMVYWTGAATDDYEASCGGNKRGKEALEQSPDICILSAVGRIVDGGEGRKLEKIESNRERPR
jgi:hypothetical protein